MNERRLREPMPEAITRSQREASNPRGSVWVTANAGSGKTYVLTARVLRLLLSGVSPASILRAALRAAQFESFVKVRGRAGTCTSEAGDGEDDEVAADEAQAAQEVQFVAAEAQLAQGIELGVHLVQEFRQRIGGLVAADAPGAIPSKPCIATGECTVLS